MAHQRKDMIAYKHFAVKNSISLSILIALFIAAMGCQNPPSPPQKECSPCPKAPDCSRLQISQLDSGTRERLKQELLAELKEETRAQWQREFELEKQETLPPPQHFQAVKEPQPPKRPTVKPDALPPTQKIERDAGGMKLLRILLTTGIDHRLPVDERDAFTIEDASVFCFVEISAAEADDRSITIRFTHSTGLAQSYTLPVSQSPAWRTWSKLNLTKSMTGTWLCEVFNEDNVLLASRPFVVVDE